MGTLKALPCINFSKASVYDRIRLCYRGGATINPSKIERLDDYEIEFLHQALPIIHMRPTSSNVGIPSG